MNNLHIKKVSGDIAPYYKKLQETFPPEEIIPLSSMNTAYCAGKYHIYLLYESESVVGYAFICDAGDNSMLWDYIIVDENRRGSGLGQYFVKTVITEEFAGKTFLVEVDEKPTKSENQKYSRHRLMLKLGFAWQSHVQFEFNDTGDEGAFTPYELYMYNENQKIFNIEEISALWDAYCENINAPGGYKIFEYKYSAQIEEDFIPDLLRIDASVFDSRILGTDSSLRTRFNANKDAVILVYDRSEAIGYIAFFPITEDLCEKIMKEGKSFDDDIRAQDVLPSYSLNNDLNLFLISAAILPKQQGQGIGTELMRRCFAFLFDKIKQGCRIKSAYSYAYSGGGVRLLSNAGFFEVREVEEIKSGDTVKLMKYSF